MEKIKLIWDFRGHDGKNTAIHHEKHLKEFFEKVVEFQTKDIIVLKKI